MHLMCQLQAGSRKSEVGNRKSEVGSRKDLCAGVICQKREVRSIGQIG